MRGASDAVPSDNKDSMVGDMMLLPFLDIFDRMHRFAKFKQLYPV